MTGQCTQSNLEESKKKNTTGSWGIFEASFSHTYPQLTWADGLASMKLKDMFWACGREGTSRKVTQALGGEMCRCDIERPKSRLEPQNIQAAVLIARSPYRRNGNTQYTPTQTQIWMKRHFLLLAEMNFYTFLLKWMPCDTRCLFLPLKFRSQCTREECTDMCQQMQSGHWCFIHLVQKWSRNQKCKLWFVSWLWLRTQLLLCYKRIPAARVSSSVWVVDSCRSIS